MKHCSLILAMILMLSCKDKTQEVNVSEDKNQLTFHQVEDVKLYGGTLKRVDSFPSSYITPRPVDVWLPENYSDQNAYAVLYMHDGQMLFDASTTWNKQEWKVDEWASKLMSENKTKNFIVVAIHNIADIRWQDLFPQKAFESFDKQVIDELYVKTINADKSIALSGDKYLKFIVEELKPVIDKSFSTLTDSENTFVIGSSMGGLMSMYAISEYPEVFGGAACISTHWVGATPADFNPLPNAIFEYMEEHLPSPENHKLYFDYGDKTLDAHYPQYAPRVDSILKQKGYTDANSVNLFFEGEDHSENSWNKRLDKPLTFLLKK
ncbi:alpha/beta hydrolase [Psychroserpens algicola]|uniref:alpha/beta hydrolase n=1 Tax=Psychroserpens algicola TaxID=1719034 RepID=UPI001952ECAD|nr:alpha/beta hydrolase-fold protein [Psychroserpens algicola]